MKSIQPVNNMYFYTCKKDYPYSCNQAKLQSFTGIPGNLQRNEQANGVKTPKSA